jgi:2-polyprenyl-3-methyl-5-hydroxy-6-metoxy-1,4-benzoquinol methylase
MHEAGRVFETTVSGVEFWPSTKSFESLPKNACLVCGGALEITETNLSDTRFGSSGTYSIFRCISCGLEQTCPRPSLAELKELYERYYNFGGEKGTRYTRWREQFLSSFLYRLWVWLDGDVAFHQRQGTGRLLDIGCNEGRGLKLYARNGFAVEGLELNEAAAATAREAGFVVYTRLMEEFNPSSLYGVVLLANVLEHSLDPRQMLRDVCRILSPNGQVWISCPNSRSWLRRVFGRFWLNWHVPFHVVHFSPKVLRELLIQTGFTNIEEKQITPALWVAQSLLVRLFAKKDKKTRQMRNAALTLFFMLAARLLLFPILWLGNQLGRGDCLLVIATKHCEIQGQAEL